MFWLRSPVLGVLVPLSFMVACSTEAPAPAVGDPVVVAFAADPSTLLEGKATTLRWITTEASSISIREAGGASIDLGGAAPEKGEVKVTPSDDTTYVLTAKNAAGKEAEAEVVVEVLASDEVVAEIWLEPETVPYGEDATLHWNSSRAERIVIRQDDKIIVNTIQAAGTHELSLMDSAHFVMEAEGVLGVATAEATLRVAPAIEHFTTEVANEQFPGELVEVSWRVRGADALRIENEDGLNHEVRGGDTSRGTASLPLGRDGIFLLVASREGVESSMELAVPVVGPPVFERITFDPPGVTAGSGEAPEVRLSWLIPNAKTLAIESSAHGLLDLEGKKARSDALFLPSVVEGTTFRFLASNGGEEIEETFVFAGLPLPTITTFEPVPGRVGVGEPFLLRWETEGADRVELYELQAGGTRTRLSIGDAEASAGSVELTVEFQTDFELVAFNAADGSVRANVNVSLGEPRPEASVEPSTLVPGEAFTLRWSSEGGARLVVSDAEGVEIHETTDPMEIASGSLELQAPAAEGAYVYTVTVTNASGQVAVPLEVVVTTGPRVLDFSASPGRIRAGADLEFAWTVAPDEEGRTTRLDLVDDLGNLYDLGAADPHEGRAVLSVDAIGYREFTLRARAEGAQATEATASVEVFGAPEVNLTANPPAFDPFLPNELPRLRWETLWATRVQVYEIDEGGQVLAELVDEAREALVRKSHFDVSPAEGGSLYRVTATNPWGESASEELFIDHYLPTVETFTITPTSVPQNGTVTVDWDTHGGNTFLNGPLLIRDMEELPGEDFDSINGLAGTMTVNMLNCTTGSGSNTDEGCVIVDFPGSFRFPYDGKMHDQARFGTNGWVGFNLAVTGPGSIWTTFPGFTYPTTQATWAQIIPWGGDLWTPVGYRWRMDQGAEGEKAVFEWHTNNPSLTQLQLVLWETGAFEYRYSSSMPSTPYGWAYQNLDASRGLDISPKPPANQLAGRVFRYEPKVNASGSMNFEIEEDTTFRICVYGADWESDCQEIEVTVTP